MSVYAERYHDISCGHRVHGQGGHCEHLHGHNYRVHFTVTAEELDEVGRVSSLEAPHRIADAILRDSLHNGQSFRKSELGKSLDQASLQNATPLYKLCPTALIFGLWDSTGPKGGLGAKFQRALVSEIIGVNAEIGVKTSSRIDPLGMRAAAKVIKKPDGSYELAGDKAKDGVSPSEVNHGNIPPNVNAALMAKLRT